LTCIDDRQIQGETFESWRENIEQGFITGGLNCDCPVHLLTLCLSFHVQSFSILKQPSFMPQCSALISIERPRCVCYK
jgi:hypothetical protein